MAELDYLLTFADIPFCSDKGDDGLFLDLIDPDLKEDTDLFVRGQHPLPELMDEVNRILSFQYLHDFTPPATYPGRKLGALAKQWQEICQPSPAVRVGDWFYPNGACRWSVFRGLATSSMVAAMLAATGGNSSASFTMRNVPSTPYAQPDANYTLESFLYMLPPRPLGELGGTFDGLYLVTLVDERYYWQNSPISLRVTKDTTWASLISQIATALSVTISGSAVPVAYGQPEPDSQLWTNMENVAVLLDAIAFNIGRVVVRGLDGTYQLLSPSESQTIVGTNRVAPVTRMAGGNMFAPPTEGLPVGDLRPARNAVVPSSVTVTFPKYVRGDDPVPHFLNSRYANQRPSCWFEESYGDTHNIEVPVASGGSLVLGLTGTGDHVLHTTAKALYETEAAATGSPANVSDLTALALQAAQDFYNGQVAAALDEVYPGTYHWVPEGIHDILWTWSERVRHVSTRVTRSPWNQIVTEFQHSAPAIAGSTNVVRGVGGPSVPQTWRDNLLQLSGQITADLNSNLQSGDMVASLVTVANFPTQNRWKGTVDNEICLFEGTSGGTTVSIAQRGIDGSIQTAHLVGAPVTQQLPNTTYGVNLVTSEKMQWIFPGVHSSGGITEAVIVPQTQTVRIFSASGRSLGGVNHYSGQVLSYDTLNGLYTAEETIWVRERNDEPVVSGKRYDGQLAGHSLEGAVSPVYLINTVGSGIVEAGSHTLLWPPVHTDTVSGAPALGSLIVGNSGNLWQRFPIGNSGEVLTVSPTSNQSVIWSPPTASVGSGTIEWFHIKECGISGIQCSGYIFNHHLTINVIRSGNIASGAIPGGGAGEDWSSVPQVGSGTRGECWFVAGEPVGPTSVQFAFTGDRIYAAPFLVAAHVNVAAAGIRVGNVVADHSGFIRLGLYRDGGQHDHYPSSLVTQMSGPLVCIFENTETFQQGNIVSGELEPGIYWWLAYTQNLGGFGNIGVHAISPVNDILYMNRMFGFDPTASGGVLGTNKKKCLGERTFTYPGDNAALPDPAPAFFPLSGHWSTEVVSEFPAIFHRYD